MSEALSQAIYAIDNALGFLAVWCPHGMDSRRSADYGSANRARDLLTQARDELAGARMESPVLRSRAPFAPDLPTRPAGADEPEADPPQAVAADPSVVDSESDTVYGDAMREHERQSWLRRVQAQPIR